MSSSEQVELELGQKAFVLGGGSQSDGSDPARRRGNASPLRVVILFRVAVIITATCSCLAVGVGIGISIGKSGGGSSAGEAEVSGFTLTRA